MSFVEDLASAGVATQVIGGDNTLHEIQRTVHLRGDAKALDVGSGGGEFAIRLASALKVSITSIDRSPAMIRLAQQLQLSAAAVGDVDFVCVDLMDELPSQHYDLVAHRGIEVFFADSDAVASRLASLVKPLGYLVAVIQTYEIPPPKELLDRVNAVTGYDIKAWSKRNYIDLYEKVGLSLIKSTELAVEPAEIIGSVSDSLKDAIEVCNENDAATNAFLLIFRKSSQAAMLGVGVMSAKA